MNVKLNINSKKMFMPLKNVKGTTEQRLQQARDLNVKFYENLQKHFVDRKVTPAKFRTSISKAAGKAFSIDMEDPVKCNLSMFSHRAGKMNATEIDTYVFTIPRTSSLDDSITQSTAASFLKATQEFFNEITNPKFLKRGISISNKTKSCKKQMEFYEKNIAGNNTLTEKRLDNLLKVTPAKIKVDTLQLFRYKLLSENNVREATPQIKKSIAKADNIMYLEKGNDLSRYGFEEKMALLNKKLAEVLSEKRQKQATKINATV